jgi:hypothetical protein
VADETYDVEAKIDVKALTASQGVGGLVRGLLGVQKQAHVAGSGISALLKGTLGFAGAYLGVRTLTSGIRGLVGASFEYATALDTQKTSLAAVLAATQPASWAAPSSASCKTTPSRVWRRRKRCSAFTRASWARSRARARS